MTKNIEKDFKNTMTKDKTFSGSVIVKEYNKSHQYSKGYAHRSDKRENQTNTRFGIASGCKLFTAIAICQLVQNKKLSFTTKLSDCLHFNFPHYDNEITIHHLLTHTSGIADYFDEEEMDDFEQLWVDTPMYHLRKLTDFLPLFQNKKMKGRVGERFHYNNAGFILLGLVVEQVTQISFTEYVTEHIFKKLNMKDSGYFELDALPENTALGYIVNPDGTWRTNIYSLPVKGGADGGAFVTTEDMVTIWKGLIQHKLLNEKLTQRLLTCHAKDKGGEEDYYGYGVWIKKHRGDIIKYHVMGYDPGVSFHSAFYPEQNSIVVVCCNQSDGAYGIAKKLEDSILLEDN